MKIGEVALQSGVASSTIRYYEELGLLPQVGRGANGYRDYTDGDVMRLRLVRNAQKLGFSLDAIRGMFSASGECAKSKVLELVAIRLQEVDAMAAAIAVQRLELVALRGMLEDGGTCAAEMSATTTSGTEQTAAHA